MDSDPAKLAMSGREAEAKAIAWFRETFGSAREAPDKDAYYARLGLLIDFIKSTFP